MSMSAADSVSAYLRGEDAEPTPAPPATALSDALREVVEHLRAAEDLVSDQQFAQRDALVQVLVAARTLAEVSNPA